MLVLKYVWLIYFVSVRYDNLDIIEDGINLRPLLTLAEKYYDGENPAFKPKKRLIKKQA